MDSPTFINFSFFSFRRAGNEGALAGSMGPPGWACAQTQGASLVRWPPPPRYHFSPHTLLPPYPSSSSFKQVRWPITSCLNIHKCGFVDWIPADRWTETFSAQFVRPKRSKREQSYSNSFPLFRTEFCMRKVKRMGLFVWCSQSLENWKKHLDIEVKKQSLNGKQ